MMRFTKYTMIASSVIVLLFIIIGVFIINKNNYETKEYIATVEWINTFIPGSSTTEYILYCNDDKLIKLEKNVIMQIDKEDKVYIEGLYQQTNDMLSNDIFKVNGVTYEIEKDGDDTIRYSRQWEIEDMNIRSLAEENESLMKYWMFYSSIDNGHISVEKFEKRLVEEGYIANE